MSQFAENPPELVPIRQLHRHRKSRDRLIRFAVEAASSTQLNNLDIELTPCMSESFVKFLGHHEDLGGPDRMAADLLYDYFALMFEWICDTTDPTMSMSEGFRRVVYKWRSAVSWSLIAVPPMIAFNDNVASFQIVAGQSMSPTLNKGGEKVVFNDIVVVSKTSEFSKGDIVLLTDPTRERRTNLVKRVADISRDGSSVYVLGDNADHSTDSRHFGDVPAVMVQGVVKAIVFPPWRVTSL